MVYLGACLIAGVRLARERQINIRVVPTRQAIEESVDRFTANVLPGQTSACSRAFLVIDELIDTPKKYLRRQITPPFTAQWAFDDDRLEWEFGSTSRNVSPAFLAGNNERLSR